MYEEIRKSARAALLELLDVAALTPGQQVVIGCSSSQIMGQKIGKGSTPEAAKAVVDEILPILKARGLCLEAQCCEHLNRALIMERADAERLRPPAAESRRLVRNGGLWGDGRSRRGRICEGRCRPRYRQYHDRHAPQARGRAAAPVGQDDRRSAGQCRPHAAEAHRRQPRRVSGLIPGNPTKK